MRRTLLAAASLSLLTCGCGSGSGLSEKQFRAHATRTCTQARRQTERIPTPSSAAQAEAFLKRGITILAPELAQLKGLKPPGDLAQVYGISISAFGQKLSALQNTARQLHHGADPAIAMKTLQRRLGPLESSEDGAWNALEIPACMNR